jgi:hypothetical protein
MSNFAPGLWSVRPGTFTVYAQHGRSVIKVADTRQKLFTPECQVANARLIAAAPELLAAAQRAAHILQYCPDKQEKAVALLLAAIAKAKGE